MPASLYVHIPFCIRRCIYCDFVSGVYDSKKAEEYLDALKKEILYIPPDTQISSLYIGGGTPSVLSADALTDLIIYILNHFYFIENYESTIEANPKTADREKLGVIRSLGTNRISIGAQSFNDSELACLGRLHSSLEAEQAVCMAGESGYKNIGIDLIYGIPGQDIDSWRKTLQRTVSLKPKHISTYELTAEQGTLLYELIKTKKLKPVEEEKIIEMYNYAIDYLNAEGFLHYEISNFAIPGYECRHNLNYWNRGEYYGAGLGAHSFTGGKRFFNTDKLGDYIRVLSENKSPVMESENINGDKALSEAIFLGLRKTRGIDLVNMSESHGRDVLTKYKKEVEELQREGLIEIYSSSQSSGTSRSDCCKDSSSYIRLTRKGFLLSNEVFARFI